MWWLLRYSREGIAFMGSILLFEPREPVFGRKPADPDKTAMVVIFPGVRYERSGPSRSVASPPASARGASRTERPDMRPRDPAWR